MMRNLLLTQSLLARTIQAKIRHCNWWEADVPNLNDDEFKEQFRVSRKTFQFLVERLTSLEKQPTVFRAPIPLQKRIAIALYTLGKIISLECNSTVM